MCVREREREREGRTGRAEERKQGEQMRALLWCEKPVALPGERRRRIWFVSVSKKDEAEREQLQGETEGGLEEGQGDEQRGEERAL